MALNRKKGFSIVSKSQENKLWTKAKMFTNFEETRIEFNKAIHYFFMLVNTDPCGAELSDKKTQWRYYEMLVKGKTASYPLPSEFKGFPAVLMRAAIRKAIGAYKSWKTSYDKWLYRPKRHQHHRPPVQPRSFNFSLQYDKGMWKEDSGSDIMLKVLINGQWKWIKFYYSGRDFGSGWVKGAPSVVCKRGMMFLTFPYEKYISATGGLKNVCGQDTIRFAALDIDLDRHAAIVSILECKDNSIREVARHFIRNPKEINLRKRNLGRIALKMQKTGIIHEGFCFKQWEHLRQREKDMGYKVARQITNLAFGYKCKFISFEHLGNLRPCKGTYSKRSNQKRSYWLKSKIFNNVRNFAFRDYGILTTRVNPRDTSRLDPWGNAVYRSNEIPETVIKGFEVYQSGATWVKTASGYTAHSGVNASRNIGIKAIVRHRTNLKFVVNSKQDLEVL